MPATGVNETQIKNQWNQTLSNIYSIFNPGKSFKNKDLRQSVKVLSEIAQRRGQMRRRQCCPFTHGRHAGRCGTPIRPRFHAARLNDPDRFKTTIDAFQ